MRTKTTWLSGIVVVVALGLAIPSFAVAQTTTSVDVRNFEVISVAGDRLVFRDQRGTNELTVPADFRFTVDGKQMAVSELKAGMKGTATVTTTTTIRPVVVTEVREGEVLRASDVSMTVRQADGVRKYSQGQLDAKGIQIIRDGTPVRTFDLKRGDKLTATIITSGPPVVLTEQEVQATLAESTAEPTAKAEAANMQVAASAGIAPPAAPAAQPVATAASPKSTAAPPASQPAEQSGLAPMWYVIIGVLVALLLFVFMRRRKQA